MMTKIRRPFALTAAAAALVADMRMTAEVV